MTDPRPVDDDRGRRRRRPQPARSGRTSRSHVVDLIEAAQQHDRLRQLPAADRAADGAAQRDRDRPGPAATSDAAPGRRRPRSWPSPGASLGAETVIAKAHHGSVSKEQRALIEDDLKRGRLPAVVATSSLELGIDMGAVDLVVQIESPPSVASALQRVGRAGHQVGEVSRGVLYPKHRGDLAQTAVAVQRMRTGAIECAAGPDQPARRARPAGRRHGRARAPGRSTTSTTWSAGRRRSRSCRARRTTRRSTCSPVATPPTSSPSSGRGSSGTG